MTRSRVWLLTGASSLGIASPGYLHHGLAAIGPFIIAAFGLSKSSYGFLISAFSLVGAVTSPAVGSLADRVGGVRLLRWAFFVAIGVSVGMALSSGLVVLLLVVMVGGFTASAANPATNTLIGIHVPPRLQGLTVGIKQAGGPLGIAAAGAAMPPIAARWGWEWAVLSGVALPLIGLIMMSLSGATVSEVLPARDRSVDRPPLGSRIRILTVNAAAIGWGLGAILGFVAVYGVEEVGMTETEAGSMIAVIGVVGTVARLGWGAVADRFPASSGLLAALGLLAFVGAVGVWASAELGPRLLVVSAVVLGASAMAWNSVGMLAVIREASVERAGAASGVVVFGFLGGFSVGPWAFGTLVDLTGGYTLSFVTVAIAFLFSVVVLVIRPDRGHG